MEDRSGRLFGGHLIHRLSEHKCETKLKLRVSLTGRCARLHLTKLPANGRSMTAMTLPTDTPRRRPLWPLFLMPILLLIAAAAWSAFWFYAASQAEVKADAWRAQEAKSGRIYDCAKRSVAASRSALRSAATAPRVTLTSQTAGRPRRSAGHGQPRRNPGRRAGLRSEIADRGIHRAGDDFRIAARACDAGELEQGARQRGRTAGHSAARLDRVRRCRDRPRQRIRCRCRWRAPNMSNCTAGLPRLDRRSSRDRDRAADRRRQRAGSASAAGAAVRCRHADDAERA